MMSAVEQPKRILIAEDCLDTQKILQMMLEQTGAEVFLADNGEECLDQVFCDDTPDFNLVIMDIKMPKVNGLQALETLREKGCNVPTLVITATPSEDGARKVEQLGGDAYLSKLNHRTEIIPTVTKMLEGRKTKRNISLPVLPVYPETFPQDRESYKALFSFLNRVDEISREFSQHLDDKDHALLKQDILKLSTASFYGYHLLITQIDLFRSALKKGESLKVITYGKSILRTLGGMVAGLPKLEKKARVLGTDKSSLRGNRRFGMQ